MENQFASTRTILYMIALGIFALGTYMVFKDVVFYKPQDLLPENKDNSQGVAFTPPRVGEVSQNGMIALYSGDGDNKIYSLNDKDNEPIYILNSPNIDLSLSAGGQVEILGSINGKLDGITVLEVKSIKYK